MKITLNFPNKKMILIVGLDKNQLKVKHINILEKCCKIVCAYSITLFHYTVGGSGIDSGHEVALQFASMSSVSPLERSCFCKWKQCQHKHHFLNEI